MKKEIFIARDGKAYGPDVINLPEFCALNRWVYDSRGQIDMSSAIAAGLTLAFEEKKIFDFGPYGLRADDRTALELFDMIHSWLLMHLHPVQHVWDTETFRNECREKLEKAGFSTDGWENLK